MTNPNLPPYTPKSILKKSKRPSQSHKHPKNDFQNPNQKLVPMFQEIDPSSESSYGSGVNMQFPLSPEALRDKLMEMQGSSSSSESFTSSESSFTSSDDSGMANPHFDNELNILNNLLESPDVSLSDDLSYGSGMETPEMLQRDIFDLESETTIKSNDSKLSENVFDDNGVLEILSDLPSPTSMLILKMKEKMKENSSGSSDSNNNKKLPKPFSNNKDDVPGLNADTLPKNNSTKQNPNTNIPSRKSSLSSNHSTSSLADLQQRVVAALEENKKIISGYLDPNNELENLPSKFPTKLLTKVRPMSSSDEGKTSKETSSQPKNNTSSESSKIEFFPSHEGLLPPDENSVSFNLTSSEELQNEKRSRRSSKALSSNDTSITHLSKSRLVDPESLAQDAPTPDSSDNIRNKNVPQEKNKNLLVDLAPTQDQYDVKTSKDRIYDQQKFLVHASEEELIRLTCEDELTLGYPVDMGLKNEVNKNDIKDSAKSGPKSIKQILSKHHDQINKISPAFVIHNFKENSKREKFGSDNKNNNESDDVLPMPGDLSNSKSLAKPRNVGQTINNSQFAKTMNNSQLAKSRNATRADAESFNGRNVTHALFPRTTAMVHGETDKDGLPLPRDFAHLFTTAFFGVTDDTEKKSQGSSSFKFNQKGKGSFRKGKGSFKGSGSFKGGNVYKDGTYSFRDFTGENSMNNSRENTMNNSRNISRETSRKTEYLDNLKTIRSILTQPNQDSHPHFDSLLAHEAYDYEVGRYQPTGSVAYKPLNQTSNESGVESSISWNSFKSGESHFKFKSSEEGVDHEKEFGKISSKNAEVYGSHHVAAWKEACVGCDLKVYDWGAEGYLKKSPDESGLQNQKISSQDLITFTSSNESNYFTAISSMESPQESSSSAQESSSSQDSPQESSSSSAQDSPQESSSSSMGTLEVERSSEKTTSSIELETSKNNSSSSDISKSETTPENEVVVSEKTCSVQLETPKNLSFKEKLNVFNIPKKELSSEVKNDFIEVENECNAPVWDRNVFPRPTILAEKSNHSEFEDKVKTPQRARSVSPEKTAQPSQPSVLSEIKLESAALRERDASVSPSRRSQVGVGKRTKSQLEHAPRRISSKESLLTKVENRVSPPKLVLSPVFSGVKLQNSNSQENRHTDQSVSPTKKRQDAANDDSVFSGVKLQNSLQNFDREQSVSPTKRLQQPGNEDSVFSKIKLRPSRDRGRDQSTSPRKRWQEAGKLVHLELESAKAFSSKDKSTKTESELENESESVFSKIKLTNSKNERDVSTSPRKRWQQAAKKIHVELEAVNNFGKKESINSQEEATLKSQKNIFSEIKLEPASNRDKEKIMSPTKRWQQAAKKINVQLETLKVMDKEKITETTEKAQPKNEISFSDIKLEDAVIRDSTTQTFSPKNAWKRAGKLIHLELQTTSMFSTKEKREVEVESPVELESEKSDSEIYELDEREFTSKDQLEAQAPQEDLSDELNKFKQQLDVFQDDLKEKHDFEKDEKTEPNHWATAHTAPYFDPDPHKFPKKPRKKKRKVANPWFGKRHRTPKPIPPLSDCSSEEEV